MRCRRNVAVLALDLIIEFITRGGRAWHPQACGSPVAPPAHSSASNRGVGRVGKKPYMQPYRACMRKGPSCSSGGVPPPAQGATSSVSGRTSAEGLQTLILL